MKPPGKRTLLIGQAIVVVVWSAAAAIAFSGLRTTFTLWIFALDAVMVGANSVVLARRIKEYRNGHRGTARDRDDPYSIAHFHPGGAAGAPSGDGTSPGLIETTAEVPILAYKGASLAWRPHGGAQFRSLNQGILYGVDADARCAGSLLTFVYPSLMPTMTRPSQHAECPAVGCRCGFYALSDVNAIDAEIPVILDVELTGRVIVHEHGYRAAHQRVIGVHLRGCYYCGEPAELCAYETDPFELRPLCSAHHLHQPHLTVAGLAAALGVPVDVMEQAR